MPQEATAQPPDLLGAADPGINPQQKMAVEELVRRKSTLNSQQQIAIDELARRFKITPQVSSNTSQQAAQQTATPPGGPKQPPKPKESLLHGAARETVGALPAIGATLGGIGGAALGAPTVAGLPAGAMAGAAVGAGAGETARQLVGHWFPDLADAPKSTLDAAAQVVTQTALGGATEGLDISKFLPPWLKSSATKAIRKVISPAGEKAQGRLLEAEKAGLQDRSKELIAATRGQLQKRVIGKSEAAGKSIAQAEAGVATDTRPIKDVIDGLDALQEKLMAQPVPTGGGQFQQQPRFGREDDIEAIKDAKNWLKFQEEPGKLISRGSMRALKQDLDRAIEESAGGYARLAIKGAKGETTSASEKVTKDMANVLRGIMNADKPDIAKLNAEFHLWDSVRRAMAPSTVAEEFKPTESAWRTWIKDRAAVWTLVGVGGGEEFARRGLGASGEVALGAAAMLAVSEALRTTAWRTSSAAAKNFLADSLARGQFDQVAKIATRYVLQDKTGGKIRVNQSGLDTSKLNVATSEPPKVEAPSGPIVEIPRDSGEIKNQPAFRNNNPGNLEFNNQPGAELSEDGRFAKFKTPQAGYDALLDRVRSAQKSGGTLEDYIVQYAPVSENDTGAYLERAENELGVDGTTPVKDIPLEKLAALQASVESGTKIRQPEKKPAAKQEAARAAMTPEAWIQ